MSESIQDTGIDPAIHFANDCDGHPLLRGDIVRRAKGSTVLGIISYVFRGGTGVTWANVKNIRMSYGRPISGRNLRFVRRSGE